MWSYSPCGNDWFHCPCYPGTCSGCCVFSPMQYSVDFFPPTQDAAGTTGIRSPGLSDCIECHGITCGGCNPPSGTFILTPVIPSSTMDIHGYSNIPPLDGRPEVGTSCLYTYEDSCSGFSEPDFFFPSGFVYQIDYSLVYYSFIANQSGDCHRWFQFNYTNEDLFPNPAALSDGWGAAFYKMESGECGDMMGSYSGTNVASANVIVGVAHPHGTFSPGFATTFYPDLQNLRPFINHPLSCTGYQPTINMIAGDAFSSNPWFSARQGVDETYALGILATTTDRPVTVSGISYMGKLDLGF